MYTFCPQSRQRECRTTTPLPRFSVWFARSRVEPQAGQRGSVT